MGCLIGLFTACIADFSSNIVLNIIHEDAGGVLSQETHANLLDDNNIGTLSACV